ncbi:MAG: hypothetical protein VX733_13225 [Candidatus Latescibacterota bacterium]|nr:hypothetical protein [Candidatus Latescibacterota bacterium]
MRKVTVWTAFVFALVLAGTQRADAGEATITKVRGATLTVDKGAEDGIEIGLKVTAIRAPEEVILHPLTGENLGAPELELADGEITKVSARAASVRLGNAPLLSVRPGDIIRYLTVEEQMLQDQEMATQSAEAAADERKQIRSDASRLTRNLQSIQGTIRGLERAIKDLRSFDKDVVQPQFNRINRDILEMHADIEQLKETVLHLSMLDLQDVPTEAEAAEKANQEREELRQMIEQEIERIRGQLRATAAPMVGDGEPMPPPGSEGEEMEQPFEEESSFLMQPWFFGLIGALGLAGVAFFMYTRMSDGGGDEEDDEESEDFAEEDEEDDEIEVDVEEDDDIVVEETS